MGSASSGVRKPVTLADGTRCASIAEAARALKCAPASVRRAIAEGRPLVERVNVEALSARAGIGADCVRSRVRRGMILERALELRPMARAAVCAKARASRGEIKCARILDAWYARWTA